MFTATKLKTKLPFFQACQVINFARLRKEWHFAFNLRFVIIDVHLPMHLHKSKHWLSTEEMNSIKEKTRYVEQFCWEEARLDDGSPLDHQSTKGSTNDENLQSTSENT